jgi:glycosyltransferase involved in cell wall biosynthesis
MSRLPLSVMVTTLDEADNLPDCLHSVRWADDVLVVDSGSRDGTVEIARRAGARVVVHPYESAARQKNWALPQLRHPWVLILDADERVPADLAAEITGVVRADGPLDGYFLRRQSFFLGRAIRHCGWDRDEVLRFFRAGRGRYDDRLVHETLQLDGRSGRLRTPLLHYTYRSFSDYLERLDRYTARGAADLRAAGRRPSWAALLLRPPARFLRMYILQLGFLDGVHGLLLCTLAATSVWLKYARLWEFAPQSHAVRPNPSADDVRAPAPSIAGPEAMP